jgi:hypothetical protein
MIHKDLNLLLDFLLPLARPFQETGGNFAPFAAMMTAEGKIARLGGHVANGHIAPAEALRSLEDSLRVMARQGRCKAVGFCFVSNLRQSTDAQSEPAVSIFLEHRDGSAYRFVVPWDTNRPAHLSSKGLIPIPSPPKIFAKVAQSAAAERSLLRLSQS